MSSSRLRQRRSSARKPVALASSVHMRAGSVTGTRMPRPVRRPRRLRRARRRSTMSRLLGRRRAIPPMSNTASRTSPSSFYSTDHRDRIAGDRAGQRHCRSPRSWTPTSRPWARSRARTARRYRAPRPPTEATPSASCSSASHAPRARASRRAAATAASRRSSSEPEQRQEPRRRSWSKRSRCRADRVRRRHARLVLTRDSTSRCRAARTWRRASIRNGFGLDARAQEPAAALHLSRDQTIPASRGCPAATASPRRTRSHLPDGLTASRVHPLFRTAASKARTGASWRDAAGSFKQ